MGVAKLAELCIDGTRVRANASRHKTWTAERVEKLLKELDGQIETAMAELETNDSIDELFDDGTSPDKLPPALADLTSRRTMMNEVLEQLRDMDARRKAEGIDPKKNPAQLPKSELDGRILPNKEGGYAPNFTPVVVNEMTNGFIVEADVLIGNVEHLHVITTVDTISETYAVDIDALMADSAFATGPNIAGLEERGIEFLSPLAEVSCENNPAVRDDPQCRWRLKISSDCPSIGRQKSSTSRRLCTTLMPIAFTVRLAKRCLAEARRLAKQWLAPCCM